jgi:hypothetical protein
MLDRNAKRRMRAKRTLRYYMGMPGISGETEDAIVDLISDLLHLAQRDCAEIGDKNFAPMLAERAIGHYREEA